MSTVGNGNVWSEGRESREKRKSKILERFSSRLDQNKITWSELEIVEGMLYDIITKIVKRR